MDYISNTQRERKEMLEEIGTENIEDLFSIIPKNVLLDHNLDLPEGKSEMELMDEVKSISKENTSLEDYTSFLGAGSYDHYIPSIVDHLILRSEFYTAYTPYQAELSQGTLQALYEYQSMMAELTGMDIVNGSMLDGGSATAESILMATRITRKNKVLLSEGIHPSYRKVSRSYGDPKNIVWEKISLNKTSTDPDDLKTKLDDDTAAVVVQYPNFYGTIEKLAEIKEIVDNYKKVMLIVIANPLTLGVLTPPGKLGADIVTGEGQSLGNLINYGGPYLGYIAIKDNRSHLRQLPGRLSGATEDVEGNKGFVLALQTREQHIRREKAPSNICSNEALNALISAIYMSALGRKGIKEVGEQSLQKAHYLADRISDLSGFNIINDQNFFHEFLVDPPVSAEKLVKELKKKNILAGIDISRFGEKKGLLVSVTEKRKKEELDEYAKALEVFE
ncbi:MAG: aminomethyl-transferring glycine dehydrogenase subunit GcvPA [Halanaerobiales bacterium]